MYCHSIGKSFNIIYYALICKLLYYKALKVAKVYARECGLRLRLHNVSFADVRVGGDSAVCVATRYGLDGPRIESR